MVGVVVALSYEWDDGEVADGAGVLLLVLLLLLMV